MADLDQFQLGFKNFKKFVECPSIDVSGVTFLVGKNNSGKSTYINGVLLMRDNFETTFIECEDVCHPKFTINNKDAMIFSFGDALSRNAETNEIIFSYNGTEICVYSDKKEDKEVPIKYLKFFEDTTTWFFDFVNQRVICTINLMEKKEKMMEFVRECEAKPEDYWGNPIHKMSYDDKKKRITFLDSFIESNQTPEMTITVPFPVSPTPGNVKEKLKNQIWKYAHANDFGFDNILRPNEIELVEECKIGSVRKFEDPDQQEDKKPDIPIVSVHYIPAYLVPKQREYNVEDTNDLIAQALHDYDNACKEFKNSKGIEDRADCMHRFVQYWLNQFEIGTDFRIESIDGHTYSCQVLNMTKEWIHLAELGRGPAHLTMMLIRIACVFKEDGFLFNHSITSGRSRSVQWRSHNSLIALEEPEQNLHPALQSKLADLFCSLSVIHGHPCLIETHSEYLIRRAQVIVKDKKYIGLDVEDDWEGTPMTGEGWCIMEPGVEDDWEGNNYKEEGNNYKEYYDFSGNTSQDLKKNPFHVYYFPHVVSSEGKDESELPYEMVIREDGFFERSFGPGFFDEAGKWHLQLLNYSCN